MSEKGFFLRHFLGDKPGGSVPAGTPMSNSPDIILEGRNSVGSIAELTTQSSYETEPPDTLIYNKATNYIYVRALNTTEETAKARYWLWYAEPSMLLWPQNWEYEKFNVENERRQWVDVSGGPNAIVAGNAFELLNPEAPKEHYCMIAITQYPIPEHLESPSPGYFKSGEEFAKWIQDHPNAAWRNTVDQPMTGSTWSYSSPIEGPEQESNMNLGIQCKNMPVGSKYSFSVPSGVTKEGKPWPGIEPEERLVKQPRESVSLPVTWPKGVRTSLNITWWAEGTTPQPGSTIEPYVAVSASQMEGWLDEPYKGAVKTLLFEEPWNEKSAHFVYQHIIGGMPFRFTPPKKS